MTENAAQEDTSQSIRDYLLSHPDFLLENQDLLDHLNIAHQSGAAVSLIERQVERLRSEKSEMANQIEQLISNAAANHHLLQRFQSLLLDMLVSKDLATLLNEAETQLKSDFGLDRLTLLVDASKTGNDTQPSQVHALESDTLTSLESDLYGLGSYVGRVPAALKNKLGEDALNNCSSIALVKLGSKSSQGYLLLGSQDERRFETDMATDFVEFFAALTGILWTRYQ